MESEMKLCTGCGETKPSTEEYYYRQKVHTKKKGTYYKLTSQCKECHKKKSKEWAKNNPERVMEVARKHNANPLERTRQLRIAHANRQRETGYYKEWQRNNPEKISHYRIDREMNKTHTISKKEWEDCKSYFNNECAYCGMSEEEHKRVFGQKLHREHVEHYGANDLSNCVPSCKSCNGSKRQNELSEWYNENNSDYTEDRIIKIHKWLDEDYKLFIEELKPKKNYNLNNKKESEISQ